MSGSESPTPSCALSFLRHFELINGIRAAFFQFYLHAENEACCTCYFQVYCALHSDSLLEIHTAHNTQHTEHNSLCLRDAVCRLNVTKASKQQCSHGSMNVSDSLLDKC